MISDLYDALVKVFRAYRCPATVFLGEQYAAQHTDTMRVVIFQGSSSPADQFRPPQPSLSPVVLTTLQHQFINPRPVGTRVCGFTAELWATAPPQSNPVNQFRANQAYLDALVNQLVVALQQISSGLYDIPGGLASAGNADADVAGLGYRMQCLCAMPVIDVPWPAQQLSACSKTWREAAATADVSVEGPKEGQIVPPVFRVPTPPEE
jgi:hypothetical protein